MQEKGWAVKEAKARVKINKLLEQAGWRFFDGPDGKANIVLEPNVKLTPDRMDSLGDNFDAATNGFVDFLLLDAKGFPFIVLEAKAEDKNPLVGKEQARKYAKSLNCRFVLLSNGNLHYFWDLMQGNPNMIAALPTPGALQARTAFEPDMAKLAGEEIADDYIARTQMPGYAEDAGWKNPDERAAFVEKNRLRFLRPYQLNALRALQQAAKDGKDRFLLEMATGTGKTLTSAAILKLFLRTGNAKRALFLVDRLELEDQAHKAFGELLKNDYTSVIYKQQRDDWRKAEIVVTTVQSLLFNNKFKTLFAPTDFDLVISDEAHRSISGNARAVFEYFVGCKLGLTATPKDYLRRFEASANGDVRKTEQRHLLDTYKTFGCESGEPTFRYSLLDGVRDGYLINPVIVDARTNVTTQILSDKGFAAAVAKEAEADAERNGPEASEQRFVTKDFERTFFSYPTNRLFCETLLQNALRDPISAEIGKTLVFAVSQNHAAKLAQMLNEIADRMFPGKYQSDFAVQVTSQIAGAQQYTLNFTDNKLMGAGNFLDGYKTSKARICVTVGMMTTGYDCPDILNLALMRPVYSPSEFVQIKGRGTRRHNFLKELHDAELKAELADSPLVEKTRYKLFDFFAVCEYFEEKFDYDEVLHLPALRSEQPSERETGSVVTTGGFYENVAPDELTRLGEQRIGLEGMRVDRMLFQKFETTVTEDAGLQAIVADERWEQAVQYVADNVLDKPEEYFTLDKLRRAAGVDRRLGLREILEKAFGRIMRFKTKEELLDEEFEKFLLTNPVQEADAVAAMRYFFKAYVTDKRLQQTLDSRRIADLNTNPAFSMADFRAVPLEWRTGIPEYIKDYVPLNTFA